LAHRGVLFLDELFEWPHSLLESLRAPLQEGVVRVARSRATVAYPAVVQLVCAANPCPCGGGGRCACTEERIWAYRARLSGPLADRLDLAPAVDPLTADDLLATAPGEASAPVAARVAAARRAAADRWGEGCSNGDARAWRLRDSARAAALRRLARAVEVGELTGRGFDRALRVARTIADLAGSEVVDPIMRSRRSPTGSTSAPLPHGWPDDELRAAGTGWPRASSGRAGRAWGR
jgi:magnesium chelatase family protein